MSSLDARPLRIWPAVVLVVLQWAATFGSGKLAPGTAIQFFGMTLGPMLGLLLVLSWWLFFSRASWPSRLLGLGLVVVCAVATVMLSHPTMPTGLIVYGIPILCLATVGWFVVTRSLDGRTRMLGAAAVVAVACLSWTLVRSEGVTGAFEAEFAWRWAATAEDRLLAVADDPVGSLPSAAGTPPAPDDGIDAAWPGFRGRGRDSRVDGVMLATDWNTRPPEEVWRRAIGPGWSSFGVVGDRLYTQEQRGEEEIVSCYDADTGEPIWMHRDETRFWEALAGAGPRATPTYHDGRIYTVGATGIVNCLDAMTGQRIWSRELVADTGATLPDWGFSSSPLVVNGMAIVFAGGPEGKGVVAYDVESGEPRWFAPSGSLSYSSPHLTTIDDVVQLLILTGEGATSIDPATGQVLWEHPWPMGGGARIVQPWVTDDGRVLIGTGFGMGVRSIRVTRDGESWAVTEDWTSRGLKPYYNDFVEHEGHVYGFDGAILASIDLGTGDRNWKQGRYGHGQLLLLPQQDLLLVLSEAGEVVLVPADPSGFQELARLPAIEGKTWNHPVLVGDRLFVRNGVEAACYRVATVTRHAAPR